MASRDAPMMASPRETRRVVARFRLAALFRAGALSPRGGHVLLRAGSFARRLGLFRLALRSPRLIHRRCRDPPGGLLRPASPFEIRLAVLVLAPPFVAPISVCHRRHPL